MFAKFIQLGQKNCELYWRANFTIFAKFITNKPKEFVKITAERKLFQREHYSRQYGKQKNAYANYSTPILIGKLCLFKINLQSGCYSRQITIIAIAQISFVVPRLSVGYTSNIHKFVISCIIEWSLNTSPT